MIPSLPPDPSTAPAAVWGKLGDQPPNEGEELILTQMVAEDGSVVRLDRPDSSPSDAPGPAREREAQLSVRAARLAGQDIRSLQALLLTDALPSVAGEAPLVPASSPAPAAAPSPIAGPAPKPIPPTPPLAPAPRPVSPPAAKDPVGLLSPEALFQSNAVLSQLARNRPRQGSQTLEELVRQSLEPKLEEWLNANLKDLVERLVQQEIDRIRRMVE